MAGLAFFELAGAFELAGFDAAGAFGLAALGFAGAELAEVAGLDVAGPGAGPGGALALVGSGAAVATTAGFALTGTGAAKAGLVLLATGDGATIAGVFAFGAATGVSATRGRIGATGTAWIVRALLASSRFGICTTTGSAAAARLGVTAGGVTAGGVADAVVAGGGGAIGVGSATGRVRLGSGAPAATWLPARLRARSTITVVTIPQAKVMRQMPARLVFDRTTSRLDTAGEEIGVMPAILEIRSVPYPRIGRGAASNLLSGAGVGVAPVLD